MRKRIGLIDTLGFEWDNGSLEQIKIHNVGSNECEEIFYNEPVYFEDPEHSTKEIRYLVYGVTNEERLLTVVFTIRNNKVRVFSSRDQHKNERGIYKNKDK